MFSQSDDSTTEEESPSILKPFMRKFRKPSVVKVCSIIYNSLSPVKVKARTVKNR